MNKEINFFNYSDKLNILFIDYSGIIEKEEGLRRIKILQNYFIENHSPDKYLKIIMDAREYILASPEIHNYLAKVARETFKPFNLRLTWLNETKT